MKAGIPFLCRLLSAVWLLWMGVFIAPCRAQQARPPVPRFEVLGVNEGLSQSTVTALFQDRQGFIWIGTGDGLNRYDGQKIQRFWVSADKGAPPATFVRSTIWEDEQGGIWFANNKGLHCYTSDSEKIQTVFTANQWAGYIVARIAGRFLWAWHFREGILRYDLIHHTSRRYPLPNWLQNTDSGYFYALQESAGGTFWTKRSQPGNFCFFNPRQGSWMQGPGPTAAAAICFGKGRSFFSDADGFTQYDSSTGSTRRVAIPFGESSPQPQRMIADRWGRVWIGTAAHGLYCYDPNTGTLTTYRHSSLNPASLPTDLTTVLFIDRADNLWVGTDGGGAARLDLKPPRFGLFPLHESDFPEIKTFFTRCFYEDTVGKLWFGTHSNGIGILNRQTGQPERYIQKGTNGSPLQVVNAIVRDPDGNLWIGHSRGFSRLNPTTGQFTDLYVCPEPANNAPQSYGTHILALRDGTMLTASRQGLMLFQRQGSHWRGRNFENHPILGGFGSSLCQMANGTIWAAITGKGLICLRRSGDSLLEEKQYFPNVQVRGLHCDEQNPDLLWIATTSGFARLNTRSGEAVFKGIDDGMSNAYIYGLLEDERHRLWMSTNGGLVCYNPKGGQFASYTYADGLQSNEFNSGAFYKGPSGTLYFGGIHGFNWIEKGSGAMAGVPPPIAMSAFTVNGRQMTPQQDQTLVLPYNQNDLAFRMAVLDYTRPAANKMSCYLKGWDADWVSYNSPEGHYVNLPPGKYTLYIRGSNAAGIWSKTLTYPICIRAPFWKMPLFYVVAGLLLLAAAAALIYAAFREKLLRQRRIIAQQKALMDERTRISQDMHDEIGSGLTRIAMMTEMLTRREGEIPEIGSIARAARGLVQNMGEIVWALHPENDRLDNLLSYLREQLHAFIEPFGLDYEIDFPENIPDWRLSNAQRRNLYLTVRESVNNALKHAGATRLRIEARIEGPSLCFRICDNGRGFELAQVRAGANGLRNMRRRMSDIGGSFDLASTSGNTCISFRITLQNARQKPKRFRWITTFFTRTKKK